MKRSEINTYLAEALAAFQKAGFTLPPFGYLPYAKWSTRGHEYDEIRRCMLGWDITDFGSGDFLRIGLTLFTLRNGDPTDPAGKTYAEKLMYVRPGQVTPMHYHTRKMEDIIVRAGANLIVELWLPDENGGLSDRDVTVSMDGVRQTFPAGTRIALAPGQSITMARGLYHSFFADGGPCVVGEVSMVNDDNTDNHFLEACGRFPPIEEDAEPEFCLCFAYPPAK
ncbi:MAG: D-lyxose/D-mannose family sugar isomerase [Eubacteriales bacterium]|nr:D-lyxose/D-mannose family sugar isomerase [Eubacteriales bacterium]